MFFPAAILNSNLKLFKHHDRFPKLTTTTKKLETGKSDLTHLAFIY